LKIPKSGRVVNKKLLKQYVYCIQNVCNVVDSRFFEGAYLLHLLRKVDLQRGNWVPTRSVSLWLLRSCA